MRNSSGLPDFLELLRLGGHGLDKPARAADLLAACARNGHLNFAPGSRFLYSNTNFLLLGLIIERLTKKKLGDVLAERIFKPLGMTSTMLAAEIDTVIPNLATGYLGDDKQGFRRAGARLSAGRRRRPDLDGRGSADLEPALRRAGARQDPARAARRRGAADRRPRQPLSPRRRRRRAARPRDGRPRRPVAGLPHRVPARAGRRPHGRRHRQSRQHRSVAAGPRHRRRRAGRRQAAEAQLGADHQAEIKPIAGTWFNAEEPSLFDLAWRNGEADRDPERPALRAGPPARRLVRRRTRLVRVHAEAGPRGTLRVDLGAGRVLTFKKLGKRKAVPAAIAGAYVSADTGATWDISRSGEDWKAEVERPADRGRRRPGRCAASTPTRSRSNRRAAGSRPASSPIWCATRPARSRRSRSRAAASRRCGSNGRLAPSGTAGRLEGPRS